MGDPRTAKDALFAETFGEIDGLLNRVDKLTYNLITSEKKFVKTTLALDDAGEKYRDAVTLFTDQAKKDLTDYFDKKALELSENSKVEKSENTTFKIIDPADNTKDLVKILKKSNENYLKTKSERIIELIAISFMSSFLTAAAFYLILFLR